MSRHSVIRAALEGLWLAQAPRWPARTADVSGFVLTLHQVVPGDPPPFAPNALLTITPEFLDHLLEHFIGRGWRFVSVDDLVATANDGDPRRIAVTLDDGYRDNRLHAWPVFRRHNAPFTIYVCPGFADRTAELWWIALERIIAMTDSLALAGHGPAESLPTRSVEEKRQAFAAWTGWLTTEAEEARQRQAVRALAEKYGLDLSQLAEELIMDWAEIREIAADPLCTIGAHTMTHPALARLPADAALREMRDSSDRIEAEIGRRPTTLAFPYGYQAAAGEREATLAGEAGFAASFTTRPGCITASGSRQGLPRISVNGLFQRLRYLDVLLSPGLWALRGRLRRPR